MRCSESDGGTKGTMSEERRQTSVERLVGEDDQPAVEPEYTEDHPAPPPLEPDIRSVADFRPEAEGETIPERNRREAST